MAECSLRGPQINDHEIIEPLTGSFAIEGVSAYINTGIGLCRQIRTNNDQNKNQEGPHCAKGKNIED